MVKLKIIKGHNSSVVNDKIENNKRDITPV
jgi:hypothetical protein